MQQIINALLWALGSIPDFIKKWWLPLSILLGVIADPTGSFGYFICIMIEVILSPLPSTPESLKITNLISQFTQSLGDAYPVIGAGLLNEVFGSVGIVVGILVIVKIYKLIPFKMS